jgi:Integrase core domain.
MTAALQGPAGTVGPTCAALAIPRASVYRHRRAAPTTKPRPTPARALSAPERQVVLDTLHDPRFVDQTPAEVFATLLDEGVYLCSIRTMYRILNSSKEVRERRRQLRHPVYQKPELLAEAPNQVWSWDITKLRGPAKWTYFYLYVILDIFSRRVLGWRVEEVESATLFTPLFKETVAKHGVPPGQLTLHADRGGPMKAKPTALPPRRPRRHQIPRPAPYLQRQPVLRSAVQDPEIPATVSSALRDHRAGQGVLPRLLSLVQC